MSSQILFVLFAGILFPDQTVSKPYQIFAEEEHQLNHGVNKTLDTRSKRLVLRGLRSFCPRMHPSTSQAGPSNPCVKGWYYCPKYNLVEAECNSMCLGCLSNIEMDGYMRNFGHEKNSQHAFIKSGISNVALFRFIAYSVFLG